MIVKIKKLHEDAIIPEYQTEGAAGFDLHALETTDIYAGQTVLVRTGLAFEIPKGYELQIRPRSGMSLTTKLRVANSPGTVDADYRGEVCIIMENIEPTLVTVDGGVEDVSFKYGTFVEKGERIAQAVLKRVERADFIVVEELSDTKRGSGGFGSSGK